MDASEHDMRSSQLGKSRPVRKVGVLGHVGNGNLGDEALVAAVIQNVRDRYPNAKICAFTEDPDDTEELHKVTAFPLHPMRKRSRKAPQLRGSQVLSYGTPSENLVDEIKARLKGLPWALSILKTIRSVLTSIPNRIREIGYLKGTDLLIVAGSQQLSDYFGGPWGFPYSILKWSILARVAGAKLVFLGVGAGPLSSRLSRIFVRSALSLASYRSYRDESSKICIESTGFPGACEVVPDLVYSLNIVEPSHAPTPPTKPQVVGINAMPLYDQKYWAEKNPVLYKAYVEKIAGFASWLVQRGYTIVFFPTQLRVDPTVSEEIRLMITMNGTAGALDKIVNPPILSFDALIGELSQVDLVVATRFHGIIFSYLLTKPVLGIAYHKKTTELMARMGQSQYCSDFHKLDLEELKQKFLTLECNWKAAREQIRHHVALCRDALETQYERVFRLVEEPAQEVAR
jgi:polysaccharide pyruvyl transferase WcaK-like protein